MEVSAIVGSNVTESLSFQVTKVLCEGRKAILLQNNGRLRRRFRVAGSGRQGQGRRQDEAAAHPGVRAQMLSEQTDAQTGADRWLKVQEDSRARGWHMVDTPVP
jgi:hypothetical protein